MCDCGVYVCEHAHLNNNIQMEKKLPSWEKNSLAGAKYAWKDIRELGDKDALKEHFQLVKFV